MSDPAMLLSLHLEGLPRRDLFRAAREGLRGACGDHTLAGDRGFLSSGDDGNQPTLAAPPDLGREFVLHDGDTIYPLVLGVNTVGRLSENAVCIPQEYISRRHCAIVVHHDGTCEVHDVASKNGTVVNGRRIHGPTPLKPGDQITLCSRKLMLAVARQSEARAG